MFYVSSGSRDLQCIVLQNIGFSPSCKHSAAHSMRVLHNDVLHNDVLHNDVHYIMYECVQRYQGNENTECTFTSTRACRLHNLQEQHKTQSCFLVDVVFIVQTCRLSV